MNRKGGDTPVKRKDMPKDMPMKPMHKMPGGHMMPGAHHPPPKGTGAKKGGKKTTKKPMERY